MSRSLALKYHQGHMVILMTFAGLLILLSIFSLSIGAVPIGFFEIVKIFFSKIHIGKFSGTDVQSLVLFNIRLPRIVFTVLIGAALGISGASLQGLFRNPLVEPGVIGVSSGAALGAITVMMGGKMLGISLKTSQLGNLILPAFAFVGGMVATIITLTLSKHQGKSNTTILILMGVAITAVAAAAIGVSIFYADEQQLRSYSFWTLGDLSGASWSKITILLPVILVVVITTSAMGKSLNALALGESQAFHAGVNVERVKIIVIILAAMAVGTSVAFAGIIGFVGLVVPHMIRITISSDHRFVLPASAIGGAALLLLTDIVARTVALPAEMPIGIITAAIGAPFFIRLLIVAKKKNLIA